MWHLVGMGDVDLLERWVRVMRPMNDDYHGMNAARVAALMARTGGETWFFAGSQFVVALRFHFVPKRRRYQLANVGFWGITTPAEVLELVVEKGYDFMLRHGISSVFAIRPKNMAHEGIESMHRLVPGHPQLRVTVEHDAPGHVMWRIEHRGLAGLQPANAHFCSTTCNQYLSESPKRRESVSTGVR